MPASLVLAQCRSVNGGIARRHKGWLDLPDTVHGDYFKPVAISQDNQYAYVLDDADGDRVGLYKLAMNGEAYSLEYAHERVDIV